MTGVDAAAQSTCAGWTAAAPTDREQVMESPGPRHSGGRGRLVSSSSLRGKGTSLSWHFLTSPPNLFGGPGGGISSAIVGTAIIVGLATLIALPVGVLAAIYLTEFAPKRLATPIQLVVDVLAGLPTIVVGVFVYGLLVIGHTQSGYAGAVALSIVMLPLIARPRSIAARPTSPKRGVCARCQPLGPLSESSFLPRAGGL
jgi:hypothetical protein